MRKRSQDEREETGSDEIRDVIKEFVDQSFDRGSGGANAAAAAAAAAAEMDSPKRELVECLRKIDLQVTIAM